MVRAPTFSTDTNNPKEKEQFHSFWPRLFLAYPKDNPLVFSSVNEKLKIFKGGPYEKNPGKRLYYQLITMIANSLSTDGNNNNPFMPINAGIPCSLHPRRSATAFATKELQQKDLVREHRFKRPKTDKAETVIVYLENLLDQVAIWQWHEKNLASARLALFPDDRASQPSPLMHLVRLPWTITTTCKGILQLGIAALATIDAAFNLPFFDLGAAAYNNPERKFDKRYLPLLVLTGALALSSKLIFAPARLALQLGQFAVDSVNNVAYLPWLGGRIGAKASHSDNKWGQAAGFIAGFAVGAVAMAGAALALLATASSAAPAVTAVTTLAIGYLARETNHSLELALVNEPHDRKAAKLQQRQSNRSSRSSRSRPHSDSNSSQMTVAEYEIAQHHQPRVNNQPDAARAAAHSCLADQYKTQNPQPDAPLQDKPDKSTRPTSRRQGPS